MLENKKLTKQFSKKKKSVRTNYNNIDDALNEAHLLSNLRKPLKTNTKTDSEGQPLKKSKHTTVSPILFLRVPIKNGKPNTN